MSEQLEFIGLTAASPQGATTKAEGGRPPSAKPVVPKKQMEEREVLRTITMEVIANEQNLERAFEKVKGNDGAAGQDGKTIEEVQAHLTAILQKVSRELRDGKYQPGMIRRTWIPKDDGTKRGLGIPDVVDRVVQQAVLQAMSPHYEPEFHRSSHGFRPQRSCHTAIAEAKKYVEDGYGWVVDIDLSKFFDGVNHDRLMSRLEKKISDHRVLKLIRSMLRAKIAMPDGVVLNNEEGVPQGGPLSPLLSNIVLDELDWELDARGHRFVRYADDANVYIRSERAGQRVMKNLTEFIEKRLKLKINIEKSAVAKPETRHFLGFRLERNALDGKVAIRLSKKSKERIDSSIREKTRRNSGESIKRSIVKLNKQLVGWMGYFRICTEEEYKTFRFLDAHIRRRLRALILRQWKRKRFIARRLIKRGVKPKTAWRCVYRGRQSWWALSHNAAVDIGLDLAYFAGLGLVSLAESWEKWNPPDIDGVPIQLSLELG